MKQIKRVVVRIVPISLIIIGTMFLSLLVYAGMVRTERENCWERLDVATKGITEKIEMQIMDNLNMLILVSDSLTVKRNLGNDEQILDYLKTVKEMTIFERIDILFPDGKMLLETGEYIQAKGELTYEQLLAKGVHISPRRKDILTGREVLYSFHPIEVKGEVKALLIGTIDCISLMDMFTVYAYEGETQLFMVDREDGNYLMNNWHEELGNIHELEDRKRLEGYEDVDFVEEMISGKTGRAAYVSGTNGENSYVCYMPMEEFSWEVAIAAQEKVIFSHLFELKSVLVIIGLCEAVLLFAYFVWNIFLATAVVKSEEKAQLLELERRTNKAKSRFLSNMSHDIRTPLNGIVGMLNIIKKHPENGDLVNDCLNKIDVSTQYLITLANDMLDINEIESDKFALANETIDLRELAEDLNIFVQPKAKSAKVVYHMECAKLEHPYVLGSSVHIHRILVNLVTNAIKYSKEKNGEVWVKIDETGQDGEYGTYRFEVRDNGIGMSEEFQKNMYNAFEQEKLSARSKYEGYGLGLTIVNRLVQKMNGTIEIKSKKGEGSTFIITLPLMFSEEQKPDEQREETLVDLSGARMLLVEDNELNMEIAEMFFADMGANVTTAVNGKIAVDIFTATPPNHFDMILMDIMMPEMDGCEATRRIRSMDRPDAKTIPIIAMTASTFAEEINRCREAGMNEHIAKPLDVNVLLAKVSKYYRKVSGAKG